jgi:hypothetical protein
MMKTLAYFGKDGMTKKKFQTLTIGGEKLRIALLSVKLRKQAPGEDLRVTFDKTFVPYVTLLRNKLERLTMKNITIGFEPGSPY